MPKRKRTTRKKPKPTLLEQAQAEQPRVSAERLLAALRGPHVRRTVPELADKLGASETAIRQLIHECQERGALLYQFGEAWSLEAKPAPVTDATPHVFVSDAADSFLFGVISDTHMGSKYERLDAAEALYDEFAHAGVERVYHAGNWIEGEHPRNRHEVAIHGLDNQCEYFAERYPRRKGITTYAVTGDDHEGWYAQREGIDIGKHLERVMRDAGRTDWVCLGYQESYVPLVNKTSGATAHMLVEHPGGGSSYALSYQPQKRIEAFEGGEKPAVLIQGHYHKMGCWCVRNVWSILAGCTVDTGSWAKKKKLNYVVGGHLVRLLQDRSTGAIPRCRVDQIHYFNRGYYSAGDVVSHAGAVVKSDRGV